KPAKQMAAPIATASNPNKMSTAYLPSLLIYPRRYVFDGVPNWYYEPAPEKAQAFRKGKPGIRRRFAAPKGGWGCSGPAASRTGRPGGWSCPCQPRQDASVAKGMNTSYGRASTPVNRRQAARRDDPQGPPARIRIHPDQPA